MERHSAWLKYDAPAHQRIMRFAAEYKKFLDAGKTERECVNQAFSLAKAAGFCEFHEYMAANGVLRPGAKLYFVNKAKNIALFQLAAAPLWQGFRIVAAHIDSPRLDIKQNLLYEAAGLAYLDTHYYGGLKKYQWTAMPLALHGVVVKKDGTVLNVKIGEASDEPVFCITDLLPHLSAEQLKKKSSEAVTGEKLDILIGGQPCKNCQTDAVKQQILTWLAEKYAFSEDDFLSSELEAVPAGCARSMGFDESMILAYGQDDRSCVFAALDAMCRLEEPTRTACCFLVDKEEIGSVGATGMQAAFLFNAVAELMDELYGENKAALLTRRAFCASQALSADVGAAYDSLYGDVFDEKNTAKLGFGPLIKKFTGVRGKMGANDANAEYLAQIRNIMAQENIYCQTMETGKVDAGGGGTIAYILAKYGMEVADLGIPLLSMHAPWEVTAAVDVYEASQAYTAFWKM